MPSFSSDPFQYLRKRAIGAIAGGGGSAVAGKTYADFFAHITARATAGQALWDALVNIPVGALYSDAAAVGSSFMAGSPWQTKFAGGGTSTRGSARVFQHGLPTEAVFLGQIALGRRMLFVTAAATADIPVAVDRNGYLSTTDGVSTNANRTCSEMVYWVGADVGGAAFYTNPLAGTGPFPYVIP